MKIVAASAFILLVLLGGLNATAADQENPPGDSIRDAFGNGMWVCHSAQAANEFWKRLGVAQNAGVQIKVADIDSIAQKRECVYAKSDHLKLIDIDLSTAISIMGDADDNPRTIYTGWVPAAEYIAYMRVHVVRKAGTN